MGRFTTEAGSAGPTQSLREDTAHVGAVRGLVPKPGIKQSVGRGCDASELQTNLIAGRCELLLGEVTSFANGRLSNHDRTEFVRTNAKPSKVFKRQSWSSFLGACHVTNLSRSSSSDRRVTLSNLGTELTPWLNRSHTIDHTVSCSTPLRSHRKRNDVDHPSFEARQVQTSHTWYACLSEAMGSSDVGMNSWATKPW